MIHAMTKDRNIEEKEMVTERIFIAEDEESIRTLMARYLSTKGFEVSEAHNGKEALEQIKTLPGLDLLLTDMIMPEMGGYALSEAVREIYPDLKTVYISGYTEHEQDEAELNTPTSIFVQKPFPLETIHHTIRHLLDSNGAD